MSSPMSSDMGLLDRLTKNKENYYALHISCYFNCIVAFGTDFFLYDGRFYSRSFSNRHRGYPAESHQRTKAGITIL